MKEIPIFRRHSLFVVILVVCMMLSILSLTAFSHADSINPGVYSKDSSPYGIPYSQWISKWWQWNMEIPTAQHPRDNYSPEKCSVNQSGPVWFLPDILGGKEERTCTLPGGKAILVPLLTGEYHDESGKMTDSQIRKAAMAGDEYGIISAVLDGKQTKGPGTIQGSIISQHNGT